MANLTAAIRQLRRVRQQGDAPPSRNFDRYRPAYEELLGATAELAGDPAFDEVKAWMIETTRDRRRLPTPDEVRARAREACAARGVDVPANSPLGG